MQEECPLSSRIKPNARTSSKACIERRGAATPTQRERHTGRIPDCVLVNRLFWDNTDTPDYQTILRSSMSSAASLD